MRTAESRPKPKKYDSFAPAIASLAPKNIFYEKPVLVGADIEGQKCREVPFESKNSGLFLLGADGPAMDRVRLFGLLWVGSDEPTMLGLIGHCDVMASLKKLGKLANEDVLILGGGILVAEHDLLKGRVMVAAGMSNEYGAVTKSMIRRALRSIDRDGEAVPGKGYMLDIRANDIAGPASSKSPEVLDWFHSVHIFVG